jgi:hypothetical protein
MTSLASARKRGSGSLYVYAFNLDEATLRSRFIDPYERGEPITWSGRTIAGGDLEAIQITVTDAPLPEGELRPGLQYEAFITGADVTNDWITVPAGSRRRSRGAPRTASALDKVTRLCRRFDVVARQLSRRHGSRPPFEIKDEHDVQDLMHALLLVEFEDVRRSPGIRPIWAARVGSTF